MSHPPEIVAVAQVLTSFGVRGEIKARILTDFPERFLDTERLSGEGVVLTSMDGKVSYNNQLDVRMRRYSRDIKRIVQEENARQNSR